MPRASEDGLTALQHNFCEEYLLDFIAAAAAKRAGYKASAAKVIGWRLLRFHLLQS